MVALVQRPLRKRRMKSRRSHPSGVAQFLQFPCVRPMRRQGRSARGGPLLSCDRLYLLLARRMAIESLHDGVSPWSGDPFFLAVGGSALPFFRLRVHGK